MIFIEQNRAKLRLIEHPATNTSQFKLKRKFDTLAVKLPANVTIALTHNTKN